MRYVVSYPRLSRITRRNGTSYFRFWALDVRAAGFFLAAVLRAVFFVVGAAAFLRGPAATARDAGRAALGRAGVAARGEAAGLGFGSGAETRGAFGDRCTSVKRI
jgi:hypothetical protein